MHNKMFILLIPMVLGSIAISETFIQTDWSGGSGFAGPVLTWDNTFEMESGINWFSSTGELNLAYSPPMEHIITGSYVRANYACPVDMDGDGDMDILAAGGQYGPPYNFSGYISWWENTDGYGSLWEQHVLVNNFPSAPVICSADLDGDGDMDIIAGAHGTINDLAWWENIDGSGTNWTIHTIPSTIQNASSIYTADIDGDGNEDLLSTDDSYNKVIWLKNVDGSGTSWIEYNISNFNNATDGYGTDVDGDGDIDAVGVSYNGDDVRWWENVDGSGTSWDEHIISNSFNGANSVFAADIDGDGDTDILGAAALGWEITWWENSDSIGNSWIEHSITSDYNWAYAVYASDLDDDGDTDVLGAAFFGDDISWWENADGSGLTWYEHLVDGNFDGARDVVTEDMDGDGDPDIIGVAQESSDIFWWDVTSHAGSGELVSSILDIEVSTVWDSLIWTSDEPAGTSVNFQVRSSIDPQNMGTWSIVLTAPGSLENYLTDGDPFVQYKVLLETINPDHSPILEDLTISQIVSCPLLGDVNGDDQVDVLDIVQIVNCILNSSGGCVCGDWNGDGLLNVLDIVLIVNLILDENPVPEECALEPDIGPCDGICPRYFFNQETGECEVFSWGCCDGVVPFDILDECEAACE